MSDRPQVTCLMLTSLDGSIHPSRWTRSPDGGTADWSALYEEISDAFEADAWMVGRVTASEMSRTGPHPPAGTKAMERPMRLDRDGSGPWAIVPDRSGRLHFDGPTLGGNRALVLLGPDVPDAHLAELAADGVSYVVSPDRDIDLGVALSLLRRELGIRRLLLEGGGGINGAMLRAGLVDEVVQLLAPAIDGGADTDHVFGARPDGLADAGRLSLLSTETLRHGVVRLHYAVRRD